MTPVGDGLRSLARAARPAGGACPSTPSPRGNSIDSVRLLQPRPRVELLDPRQVGVGQNRLVQPQQPALLGRFVEQLPSEPIVVTSEVMISSRIASSGGLVTWANNCLK